MGRNKRHRSQKGVGSPSRELTLHELDTLEEKIKDRERTSHSEISSV